MSYPQPIKRSKIIKMVVTLLSFIIVMIFAPRMDGPRIINGVEFTTKTGSPGLTNFGWLLLVLVPAATFLITTIILKIIRKNND